MARQVYVARDEADKQAALARQAAYTRRTVEVSRTPYGEGGAKPGSHVLAYAGTPGGTEANALYGTVDEICAMIEALRAAGVDYVLLTLAGGSEQLRRFARDIMPIFARSSPAAAAE